MKREKGDFWHGIFFYTLFFGGIAIRNSNNVYILENEKQCHLSMVDESWLWNRRVGHLNFDNLAKVSKKEAVRDLPKIVKPLNLVCRHCQHGKNTKVS